MPKKSTCSSLREHLWDYCAHNLQNTSVQREIEQHLLHCEDCREQVALYRLLQESAEQMKVVAMPASQTNWVQLRATLEASPTTIQRERKGFPRFWHFSAVFAPACAAVALWLSRPPIAPQIAQAPPAPVHKQTATTRKANPAPLPELKQQRDLPQEARLVKDTPVKPKKPQITNAGYRIEQLKRKPHQERLLVQQNREARPTIAQKEPDGTTYGINYSVDGEMPLAQTRRTIQQGRESFSLERVSTGRYAMGGVPTTSLASQGESDKELPAW